MVDGRTSKCLSDVEAQAHSVSQAGVTVNATVLAATRTRTVVRRPSRRFRVHQPIGRPNLCPFSDVTPEFAQEVDFVPAEAWRVDAFISS